MKTCSLKRLTTALKMAKIFAESAQKKTQHYDHFLHIFSSQKRKHVRQQAKQRRTYKIFLVRQIKRNIHKRRIVTLI